VYLYTHIIGDFFLPQINVPGIGEVFADGFAEEQTMQRILAVLASADNVNSADAQRDLAAASKAATGGIFGFGRTVDKTADQTKQGGQTLAAGLNSANTASAIFSRDLRRSATALSSSFSDLQSKPFALAQTVTETFTKLATGSKLVSAAVGGLLGTAIADMAGFSKKIGAALGLAGGALTEAAVPLAGAVAGFLFEKLNAASGSFLEVQKSGALLGGSLVDFRNNAHNANLTMAEFNNIFKQNGEVMASFGGQTNRGAREFARANMALNRLHGVELRTLGFSFEDLGQATAEMMQNFAMSGVAIDNTAIQTQALAEATANQIRQQKTVAVLTGRSIEQQKQAERAQRKDAQVQAALARLGPQQRQEIERLISAFPEMRSTILDITTFGNITSKDAAMLSASLPSLTQGIVDTVKGIKSGGASEGTAMAFKRFAENNQSIQQEFLNNADLIATTGRFTTNEFVKVTENSFLMSQQVMAKSINQTVNDVVDDFKKLQTGQNAATKALIGLQDENRKLGMSLSKLTTEMLRNSSGIVSFISDITSGLNTGIITFARTLGITPGQTIVGPYNAELDSQFSDFAPPADNQANSPGNPANNLVTTNNQPTNILDQRNQALMSKLDELIAATKRGSGSLIDTIKQYMQ
tara:strand:- start:52 stop:1977 length:1926 start_codon:yes stop_codon:yes gene_type:complete